MAIFNLSASQTSLLAACITRGIDGSVNAHAAIAVETWTKDSEAIANILTELDGMSAGVEITIMPEPIEIENNGPARSSDYYGMADGSTGSQSIFGEDAAWIKATAHRDISHRDIEAEEDEREARKSAMMRDE